MKHAGAEALDGLDPLLAELRSFPALVERKRGVFYRGSRAFLHFHEDRTGMYADVRLERDDDFTRLRVSTRAERTRLLRAVRASLTT